MKYKTVTGKKYDEIMTARWHEACKKWDISHGIDSYPQLALYIWNKTYGYVTYSHEIHSAVWRRTKKESIKAFEERYCKGG